MRPLTRAFLGTLLVAILSAACSGNPKPTMVYGPAPIPVELQRSAVRILTPSSTGLGAPVSSIQALAAQHVVEGHTFVSYRDHFGRTGLLRVVWTDAERDLALLEVEDSEKAQFLTWFRIAENAPESGDAIYCLGYLDGFVITALRGWWMGVDAEGDGIADVWSHPGSSGGPVIKQSGEMVGLLTHSTNWSRTQFDRTSPPHWLANVEVKSNFRPASQIRVVVGELPKRPR